jgi:sigma-E factor negative regulatory protein RseA
MNTKNMTQEQISAFADGELADAQLDSALAALRGSDGRARWDTYHRIGDALRSDDMAFEMSPDFTARLMRRVEQEPTIMAPVARPQMEQQIPADFTQVGAHPARRILLRGMAAAAAIATMAFVATPQLMVATKATPPASASSMLASASSESATMSPKARTIAQQDGEVLRDPGIDEYLLAHQRFSPSVYSTAQYARSATFAIDSDK